MTSPFYLRPLLHTDFDRVLELERILFGAGAWTYGMLAQELGGWGREYLVAVEDDHEAVGRLGAGKRPPAVPQVIGYAGLWFDGDVTQIMTIGIDPAWQRRGVGRALLAAMIDRSRALGASAVLLEVAVDNAPALAMYREFGFETLRTRKGYYQPENKDAYSMQLLLNAKED